MVSAMGWGFISYVRLLLLDSLCDGLRLYQLRSCSPSLCVYSVCDGLRLYQLYSFCSFFCFSVVSAMGAGCFGSAHFSIVIPRSALSFCPFSPSFPLEFGMATTQIAGGYEICTVTKTVTQWLIICYAVCEVCTVTKTATPWLNQAATLCVKSVQWGKRLLRELMKLLCSV